MKSRYLAVCDQEGKFIDARPIGTAEEIYINDILLIIQAAIWQGWDLRFTAAVPPLDLEKGPLETWKKHTNQASPKLRTEWQGVDAVIQALKDLNSSLTISVDEFRTQNASLVNANEELKKDNQDLMNQIIKLQNPVVEN